MSSNPGEEPTTKQDRHFSLAQGTNFSVSLPATDWQIRQDFEEPLAALAGIELIFPFIALYKAEESDFEDTDLILSHDRIYYVDGGERGHKEQVINNGTTDLEWLSFYVDDESNNQAVSPSFSWEEEVEAINTSCVVVEHPNVEDTKVATYMIHPYAYTTQDYLILTITVEDGNYDETRERVLQIARSVELRDPVKPKPLQILDKALTSKVTAEEFSTMVDAYWIPNVDLCNQLAQAAAENYQANYPDGPDAMIAAMQALMNLSEHSTIAFNKLLDTYEMQIKLSNGEEDEERLETMKGALNEYYSAKPAQAFAPQLLPSLDDRQQELLKKILLPGPKATKLKERMAELELI